MCNLESDLFFFTTVRNWCCNDQQLSEIGEKLSFIYSILNLNSISQETFNWLIKHFTTNNFNSIKNLLDL